MVERGLFELTDVREHEWNPLHAQPRPAAARADRPAFAPADERLTSLGGRLAAIPDALATARAVLRDVPRIHAETAIGQFAGTAALIRDELPALLAQEPGHAPRDRAGRGGRAGRAGRVRRLAAGPAGGQRARP